MFVRSAANGDDVYWACMRPDGHALLLADTQPGDEFSSNSLLDTVGAAGTYAFAEVTYGEGSFNACSKYGDSRTCGPLPTTSITFLDAKSRRTVDVPVTSLSYYADGATVSEAGAAAWLTTTGAVDTIWVTRLRAGGPRQLRAHPVAIYNGSNIGHLHFQGLVLHWTSADGGQYTYTLPK